MSGDYRFTNYLEILNFLFSNILPGGVSTCYLPSSRVSTSRNIKLKNCKILFLTFSVDFLKFSPLNLWYFEDVSIKYPKQFLYYIDFICKRHVKKIQVWISCLQLVSRPPKYGCFFEKFTVEQILKSFSGRNNSLKPPVFEFSDSLSYGLQVKNLD